MTGGLSIDFGTNSTVVAMWDPSRGTGASVPVRELSRPMRISGDGIVHVVPSLVHYTPQGDRLFGQQVVDRGLLDAPGTFRWIRHYIHLGSTVRMKAGGKQTSYFEAGGDLLVAVVRRTVEREGSTRTGIAFTAPVEASDQYDDWLSDTAVAAGVPDFRIIDEASAALRGYSVGVQHDTPYMIFDFGGSTLDVSIVAIDDDRREGSHCRSRVLGRAGEDFGGSTIDQWLFQRWIGEHGMQTGAESIQRINRSLLLSCERAKEDLSVRDMATISTSGPEDGSPLSSSLDRRGFEAMLDERGFFDKINATVQKALAAALIRGYPEERIERVLMTGGCSFLPAVQRLLQQRFGPDRVLFSRPLDAVAAGAASFAAGAEVFDRIQHEYAIRFWNSQRSRYEFRTIVRRGTAYPCRDNLARLVIKATHDGQTHFGLPIFEMGSAGAGARTDELELVTDPTGAFRLVERPPDETEQRHYVWMNERNPTLLEADPPVEKGASRFEITFTIDGNKRLLVSSRDLRTGQQVRQNVPVVKLT